MSRPQVLVPAVVGAFFGAVAAQQPVGDLDLWWHLATGAQTLAHGLARTDGFAWTIPGHAVLLDQWLGDVVIAGAYAIGSWTGIVAVRALAVALLVALVVAAALAARPRRPLVALLASLPAIALSHYAWTDRPELLGYVLFAGVALLLRFGQAGNERAFIGTLPLLALWSNIHGSSGLGLGLIVIVVLERALAWREFRLRGAIVIVAAFVATLLTPSGPAAWASSGGHFLAPPRFIQEEGVPDLRSEPGILFAITVALVFATAFLGPGRRRAEAAILVPVAFVSLTATRHMPFLAIAAAPYLAVDGPEAITATLRLIGSRSWSLRHVAESTRGLVAELVGVVFAAGILVLGVAAGPRATMSDAFPRDALVLLPPGPGLLNRYEWGGFLIWYAPATPVFVDGRLFPYVGEALDDYRAVIGLHANWRDVLTRRGIRTLLVAPSDAIAVRARDLGWPMLISTEKFTLVRVP
ncbi:MAG: hypothetical protein AUJ06_02675 [Chloroflexi bacterium 13_1_40CM_3_70_6]|nr:MAG: hypothetical protein AUJ06_02675 [Chloroflexi bacterium 13_1_40CM_3_70_6]